MNKITGTVMHEWMQEMFPFCRSITGGGVRDTLSFIKTILPDLEMMSVPTGYKAFDWTVPKEWNASDAWIKGPDNKKIAEFKVNNLHLVGYSIPIHKTIPLDELQHHLYSLEEQPSAIPYVTSYYKEQWGFCMRHADRQKLQDGLYEVFIDTKLEDGVLNYGEFFIEGNSAEEVLISTNICHPSLANNELSGPIIATALACWLTNQQKPEKSYRFVFIPETIGSLVFLSKKLAYLRKNVVAGYTLTCIGDDNHFSFLSSKFENTLSDRAAFHYFKYAELSKSKGVKFYDWLERGSDERQYGSPGVDLPIASIMRSKYATYPEYHTSLDNLDFVSAEGLESSFLVVKDILSLIDRNCYVKSATLGEPHLGPRGLRPIVSTPYRDKNARLYIDILTFADARTDLLEISERLNKPFELIFNAVNELELNELIIKSNVKS
ncbi:DUF4910 domain-containing protein [Alphaproteobacteria bacterium]|nr:DUF4910 domain-containing protein [Alphaproteobacteria bacterium]